MSSGITILVPTGQCWQVEGNIISKNPVWFNDTKSFPAGWYRVKYVTGAFRFNPAYGWGVSTNWYLVTQSGNVVDILQLPSTPNPGGPSVPNGLFSGPGFDTAEAAQNVALTVGHRDFYHTGGPLGVELHDNPYSDNIHGSPDPTWQLCELREQLSEDQSCINLPLYSTGVDQEGAVSGALADPNWTLSVSADVINPGPTAFVSNEPLPSSWVPNNTQSKWLSPRTVGSYACSLGIYRYTYSLDLSTIDPTSVQITGSWAADDTGVDIIVNGSSTGQAALGYTALTPFSIPSDKLIQGINSIDFVVKNATSGLNPTGVRVYWGGVGCLSDTSPASSAVSSGSSGSSGVSSGGSSTPCVPETPQSGLLKSGYKAMLDGLSPNPGGFGFIFRPGTYLTNEGVDNILTGDVTFVSNTLTFTCENVNLSNIPQTSIKFSVSEDFLDSFCLEIKGTKGAKGVQGAKGLPGRHGTGDGPQGATGPAGLDATEVDTFTDVSITDVDDIYDTAVVGLNLDPATATLEVIKAKMAVPESDKPAEKVYATPIYRDVTFETAESMTSWSLFAPSTDDIAQSTQSPDINIVKLPDGWSGAAVGVAPMKLSELVTQVVGYYQDLADDVITQWDREIREYIASKDKEARDIISDLAMELTEAEWSQPVDTCLDIDPAYCGEIAAGSGGSGGDGIAICEGCTAFSWDTGQVFEHNRVLSGGTPQFVRWSQETIVCVSGHDAIIFNGTSDDIVILTESTQEVKQTYSGTIGDPVTITIPSDAIIFRNSYGSITSGPSGTSPATVKKTITDGTHTYIYQSGSTSTRREHVADMEAAGFETRSIITPITKQELINRGWVDANGYFKFKFWHVVSGSGRCNITSMECIDTYKFYDTGENITTRAGIDYDMHWINGYVDTVYNQAQTNTSIPSIWMPAVVGTQWISARNDFWTTGTTQYYLTKFFVGESVDLELLRIPLQIGVDANVASIKINGHAIFDVENGPILNNTDRGYESLTSISFYGTQHYVTHGVNELVISVNENKKPAKPSELYSGLLIKWGTPVDT